MNKCKKKGPSQKAYERLLVKAYSQYGSAMGRGDSHDSKTKSKIARGEVKFYDRAVPLNSGYDAGGAYWGTPNNLRVQYTANLKYVKFYRK